MFPILLLFLVLAGCSSAQTIPATPTHLLSPGPLAPIQAGVNVAVALEDQCEEPETDARTSTFLEGVHDLLAIPQLLLAWPFISVGGMAWSIYDAATLPSGTARPNRFDQLSQKLGPNWASPPPGAPRDPDDHVLGGCMEVRQTPPGTVRASLQETFDHPEQFEGQIVAIFPVLIAVPPQYKKGFWLPLVTTESRSRTVGISLSSNGFTPILPADLAQQFKSMERLLMARSSRTDNYQRARLMCSMRTMHPLGPDSWQRLWVCDIKAIDFVDDVGGITATLK